MVMIKRGSDNCLNAFIFFAHAKHKLYRYHLLYESRSNNSYIMVNTPTLAFGDEKVFKD